MKDLGRSLMTLQKPRSEIRNKFNDSESKSGVLYRSGNSNELTGFEP